MDGVTPAVPSPTATYSDEVVAALAIWADLQTLSESAVDERGRLRVLGHAAIRARWLAERAL